MFSRTTAEQIEWIAGAFSALVVLAMIGFFVFEAVFMTDSLPELSVKVEPSKKTATASTCGTVIANSGGRAASRVTLSLTLDDGARRSVIVDDVPAHSEVTGGLYLPERTRPENVDLIVEGYVDP